MAVKTLELRKSIDEQKRVLADLERKREGFATRSSELEARINECAEEEREAVEDEVEEFNKEKAETETEIAKVRDAIDEMEKELSEAEEKEPSNDPDPQEKNIRKNKGEEKMITRDSLKYNQAFLRGVRTGNYEECRSLLTEGVDGGTVPVPTQLESEIKTAWEESQLMGLVKKSRFKGNVRVGFEVSATGAEVHVEGEEAPDEETITIGSVELKAQNIKKWITVSDEALEGTTLDTAGYLYKEIAHKIVVEAERIAITKIIAEPATANATHAGVPVSAKNPAADTIVRAVALLSGEARDLHLVMNRSTYPEFVAVALAAGYAIDVFDGLKDRIIYTEALKSFAAASTGDTYFIVGDFGDGFQANMPNGDNVTLLVDPYSRAEEDLVKIVGRQYVGMGVVAPKRFVKGNKVAAG